MENQFLLYKWKCLLATCLFLFLAAEAPAQRFSNTNHAYWYQAAPAVKSHMLVWQKNPDTLQVIAAVQLDGNRDIGSYQVLLHQQHALDSSAAMPPPLLLEHFSSTAGLHLLKVDVPKPIPGTSQPINYLLLEIQDSLQAGNSYWQITSLDPEFTYPPATFYVAQPASPQAPSLPDKGLPLFRQYLEEGRTAAIQGLDSALTLFFYNKSFEIAAPPMTAGAATNSGLDVTDTRSLHPDSAIQLSQNGLYFIQQDTTQLRGRSFRITNTYFPEVGTLEDFAGPIRYISTNEEWQQLEKSGFSKKEIDRFWLKVAQTEERAKRVIKYYYQRVSQANQLFTNYKEGWKTDQGMIYILYGPPDVVSAESGREQWIYRQTADLPEIKFTFVRVKNPFTDRHFVLLRNKNYARGHYQTVSKWRKGKNTL